MRSKDPQEPSIGTDPFRHKEKKEEDWDNSIEKDRRRKQETKTKKSASDLSWHRQKRPRGTRTGKKNDNKRLSKWQNRIPPR